eukprot:310811-Rhodomonas_salina.1
MSKIAAYFSAAGTSAPRGPASGGGGGPKKQPVCPNPACKVHHPGRLQSCPHYEQTKKIISEK